MPWFLETSVLVRYLTADPLPLATRARALVESETMLCITELALAETAHVLRSVYGLAREEIADLLVGMVQRENIEVHELEKGVVISGLLLSRHSGRVSIPDALLWASARCDAPSVVYSFDRRFPAEGIDLRQPE